MSVDVIPDTDGSILSWARRGLGYDPDWPGKCLTFGFYYNKKLTGALIFHDLRRQTDVWWTLYTVDRHWCTRKVLRLMFAVAFGRMNCRRISALVSKDNARSRSLLLRLGFREEGLMRQCRGSGEDCFIMGMLRTECPWI